VALLLALCLPRPDSEAWATLEGIVREEYGARGDAFLAVSVSEALARIDERARGTALAAVAEVVAESAGGARLAPLWATDEEPTARRLALLVAGRLPPPLPEVLLFALQPLLADRRLPDDALVAGAAALVRTVGTEGDRAVEVYRALGKGPSKARAVDRLRDLEQFTGPSAALDGMCAGLEERLRMGCPRCRLHLRRRDMVKHLWEEHQLVLDGRRVREPWAVIDDWIDFYSRTPNPELRDRCRLLSERADPDNGLLRLQRRYLSKGIDDPDARQALLDEAERTRASLCPHCYALVQVPDEVPVRPLNVWRGRLSLHGYRVEVFDRGLFARLEIVTPETVVYRGWEPGQWLTRKGAYVLLTAPLVVAALLAAFGLLVPGPPLLPVLMLLGMALIVAGGVGLFWPMPRPVTHRAVDYAWQMLIPRLHAGGYSRQDGAFVAGLALTSLQYGDRPARAGAMSEVLTVTERAVAAGEGSVEHLADLRRLALGEAAGLGKDVVALAAAQVQRCFEGRLPLTYAERLLGDRQGDPWLRGQRGRLRILVCDRAFEAGFEVRDLVGAGRVAPALAAILETDDRHRLACLRLLWSWRPRRPWDHCGKATTVFDLVEVGESSPYHERYGDLLLAQEIGLPRALGEENGRGLDATIQVCCRGVMFQGMMFRTQPRSVEVVSKPKRSPRGYEVILDGERFWFRKDPEVVVSRLERWFRFFFNEFVPQVAGVQGWASPSVAATLRARETVACPECRRAVLTRLGKVGGSLDVGEGNE
jgi:hypothetical protein